MSKRIVLDVEVIRFVNDFWKQNLEAPTVLEIAKKFKVARSSMAYKIDRMKRDGYLVVTKKRKNISTFMVQTMLENAFSKKK